MQYEKQYTIGAREIGRNNQITNYGILALLEDVAGMHSNSVGYGVKDIETKQRAWILMDWKVKILKRSKYGNIIKLKTWARTIDKPRFFTYRDFEIYDESDKLVAIATSKWVFLDLEKNKISKIDFDLINLYNPESTHVFKNEDIEKIKPINEYSKITEYKVRRFDIDVNNHMHNLNYLNLAYEALPDDIYSLPELDNVRITYKHQIKYGDNVNCYYAYNEGKHIVTIKNKEDNVTHAIIELC